MHLLVAQIKKRIPMAESHIQKVRELFERYDTDKDNSINLNELALLLQEISSKITPLPAVCMQPTIHKQYYLTRSANLLFSDRPSCIPARQVLRQETLQTRTTARNTRSERHTIHRRGRRLSLPLPPPREPCIHRQRCGV